MEAIEQKIHNSHLLTDIFGYWPSFHDAEVISIELQRAQEELEGPTLRARIYVFETTKEVDDRDYYVRKNHAILEFLFKGVDESIIKSFNHQNCLWELTILDISARQLEKLKFQVHFASSFGVEAEFKCAAVEIVQVSRATHTKSRVFQNRDLPKRELTTRTDPRLSALISGKVFNNGTSNIPRSNPAGTMGGNGIRSQRLLHW
jgi:hypothetical protein